MPFIKAKNVNNFYFNPSSQKQQNNLWHVV